MAEKDTVEAKKISKADKLWNTIKGLPIEVYALPNQTVEMHARRVDIDPNQIHLILKSGAVLPALDEVLKRVAFAPTETYELENQGTFTVLKVVNKIL